MANPTESFSPVSHVPQSFSSQSEIKKMISKDIDDQFSQGIPKPDKSDAQVKQNISTDGFTKQLHINSNHPNINPSKDIQNTYDALIDSNFKRSTHESINATPLTPPENTQAGMQTLKTPPRVKQENVENSYDKPSNKDQIIQFQIHLGIGLLRDKIDPSTLAKQEFMRSSLGLESDFGKDKLKNMNNLARESPFFNSLIKEIEKNYDQWDSVESNPTSLIELKEKIKTQQDNLGNVAELLNQWDPNKKFIGSLPPISADESLLKLLVPFFKGSAKFEIANAEKLETRLNSILDGYKIPNMPNKTDPIITNHAIQQQGALFQAERTGKEFAAKQTDLKPLGTSINVVIEMTDPNPSLVDPKAIAYFKQGKNNEKASGIMEKLIWDMAVVMGMEKQFVATKQTAIQTKTQIESGKIEAVSKGGIQGAQEGLLLNKIIENPDKYPGIPTRSSIIDGTLTTMVFGMFDAHGGNIIVDKDGNIKFFDNTASMPHSNLFLERGDGKTRSSFRSSLLSLSDSYSILSPEEIQHLKAQIDKYEKKMEKMNEFLNSSKTQSQMDGLPPGWFNTNEAMNAMKERILNIQSALNSGTIKNLRDLTMAFSTSFKFNSALQAIHFISDNYLNDCGNYSTEAIIEIQKYYSDYIGYITMEDLLDCAASFGFDLLDLRRKCNDINSNFDEILHFIDREVFRLHRTDDSLIVKKSHAEEALILKDITATNGVDLKDRPRKDIPYFSRNIFIKNLKNSSFKQIEILNAEQWAIDNIPPNGNVLNILPDSNPEIAVIYAKDSNGNLNIFPIDYTSVPGKVILKMHNNSYELPPMTMQEVGVYFSSNKSHVLANSVNAIANDCIEENIQFATKSYSEALKDVNNFPVSTMAIFQKPASDPPEFKMFRKTAEGKIISVRLVCKEDPNLIGKVFVVTKLGKRLLDSSGKEILLNVKDLKNYGVSNS